MELEDVRAQEALVRLFSRLRDLREPARLAAWCASLTANLCRDRLRGRRPPGLPIESAEDVAGPPQDDPADCVANRDAGDRLARLVRRLPEPMRLVFLLREVEGMATDEVAAALDIPAGTVKSRLFEARRRLRQLLNPSPECARP